MTMFSKDNLVEILVDLIKKAETILPEDVESALEDAYVHEESMIGRVQLKEILDNVKLARERTIPLCQDTGVLNFYVRVGNNASIRPGAIKDAITEAVRIATQKVPLRPNVVHPLKRENTGDNTGEGIPLIEFMFSGEDECIEVSVFPKGAGSENMSRLRMLKPAEGVEGIKRFVLESVAEAKGNPCPPGIIGIGIGGSSDTAVKLAKKALLRKIGIRNIDEGIANLERELKESINMLGIGPMGLGGKISGLGVNIETAFCHTGSLPVAVNIGCWATRRASVRINVGEIEFL